jgi:hypothetical protein
MVDDIIQCAQHHCVLPQYSHSAFSDLSQYISLFYVVHQVPSAVMHTNQLFIYPSSLNQVPFHFDILSATPLP